ncbi:MAG: valine--tRNA ligase [Candidatus Doudnabacteria bacterium]
MFDTLNNNSNKTDFPEMTLPPSYDHVPVEDKIYQTWLDSGFFNPDNLKGEPLSIMLPPPNVTGTLHMGHAFEQTLQDVVIRFERMRGKKTLWLPGTDHAPIATESKVIKLLEKEEGKRKTDFSREEFIEKVKAFAHNSHDIIVNQLRKVGSSVDWSREAYTFDEQRNLAVRTAFKKMFDLGLIYRGDKVINWDPKGQTTISDDEIVHEERKAKIYTFKYSKDFPISISTTRPETKVGDTAVAVHPSDERYQKFVGKEYDMVFAGVPIHIKVVADESVEKDFGTGALGVTPAHSIIDYEIAQRHNLPLKQIINEYAKMSVEGELNGKKTSEAREIIIDWLKSQDLLQKEEEIIQNISTSERTGAVIEPLPKRQWFVAVNKEFTLEHSEINGIKDGDTVTLKKLMRHVVENGQINITPENYSRIYFHWIDNLRDWCISRQIWFGHRVPVWYKNQDSTEQMFCGVEAPVGEGWVQDTDTLDTWYSSGLWTISTLGWPKQTEDLKTFHPTSLMMPGYELIFFWVARMILLTTSLTGQIPFKKVALHGIVRDKQGRKFSKSLDNGVDPLQMIEKYGTDALRIALLFGAAPGNDVAFDEQKIKGMKHFGNKLWNIARYTLANTEGINLKGKPEAKTEVDKNILDKLEQLIKGVTKDIEAFRFHEASQALYQFTWYELADAYLESSKAQLQNPEQKENTQQVLLYNLITVLKLLHPFMPFITEELWKSMHQKKLLLVTEWPK